MATKKAKKQPMSETRREYCRGLYAVACAIHARSLEEYAITLDVLRIMLSWSNVHADGFFDRVAQTTHDVMERKAGKRLDREDTRAFVHRMSLDILTTYVPIAAECRGFFRYLEVEQDGREFWSEGANLAITFAIDAVGRLSEQDGPTFAGVVATDDARVANLAASREGRVST